MSTIHTNEKISLSGATHTKTSLLYSQLSVLRNNIQQLKRASVFHQRIQTFIQSDPTDISDIFEDWYLTIRVKNENNSTFPGISFDNGGDSISGTGPSESDGTFRSILKNVPHLPFNDYSSLISLSKSNPIISEKIRLDPNLKRQLSTHSLTLFKSIISTVQWPHYKSPVTPEVISLILLPFFGKESLQILSLQTLTGILFLSFSSEFEYHFPVESLASLIENDPIRHSPVLKSTLSDLSDDDEFENFDSFETRSPHSPKPNTNQEDEDEITDVLSQDMSKLRLPATCRFDQPRWIIQTLIQWDNLYGKIFQRLGIYSEWLSFIHTLAMKKLSLLFTMLYFISNSVSNSMLTQSVASLLFRTISAIDEFTNHLQTKTTNSSQNLFSEIFSHQIPNLTSALNFILLDGGILPLNILNIVKSKHLRSSALVYQKNTGKDVDIDHIDRLFSSLSSIGSILPHLDEESRETIISSVHIPLLRRVLESLYSEFKDESLVNSDVVSQTFQNLARSNSLSFERFFRIKYLLHQLQFWAPLSPAIYSIYASFTANTKHIITNFVKNIKDEFLDHISSVNLETSLDLNRNENQDQDDDLERFPSNEFSQREGIIRDLETSILEEISSYPLHSFHKSFETNLLDSLVSIYHSL